MKARIAGMEIALALTLSMTLNRVEQRREARVKQERSFATQQ